MLLLGKGSIFVILVWINSSYGFDEDVKNAVLEKYVGSVYKGDISFGITKPNPHTLINLLNPWSPGYVLEYNVMVNRSQGQGRYDLLNHFTIEVDAENYGNLDERADNYKRPHKWSRVPEILVEDGAFRVINSYPQEMASIYSIHNIQMETWYKVKICQRPSMEGEQGVIKSRSNLNETNSIIFRGERVTLTNTNSSMRWQRLAKDKRPSTKSTCLRDSLNPKEYLNHMIRLMRFRRTSHWGLRSGI